MMRTLTAILIGFLLLSCSSGSALPALPAPGSWMEWEENNSQGKVITGLQFVPQWITGLQLERYLEYRLEKEIEKCNELLELATGNYSEIQSEFYQCKDPELKKAIAIPANRDLRLGLNLCINIQREPISAAAASLIADQASVIHRKVFADLNVLGKKDTEISESDINEMASFYASDSVTAFIQALCPQYEELLSVIFNENDGWLSSKLNTYD
tara:strand:+ start:152 stop:790 length:639 start_codon:yes stop_codon:yes gene_type:complete